METTKQNATKMMGSKAFTSMVKKYSMDPISKISGISTYGKQLPDKVSEMATKKNTIDVDHSNIAINDDLPPLEDGTDDYDDIEDDDCGCGDEECSDNVDDEKPVEKKSSSKTKKEIKQSIEMDGISVDEFNAIVDVNSKKNTMMCIYCEKYYGIDMVTDKYAEDMMCIHCFFWMNYDMKLRKTCDGGTIGITIVEYVLKCSEQHDSTKCKRHTNHGGCFLCEYKMGIKIENIKDSDKLYGSDIKNVVAVNDKDIFEDDGVSEKITVYI